ncbi:RNA polymerase sigma factor [Kribbella sp. CA-253562]|uniref:RNA polymerase sigma factor n=1 Tax=Kribbella sp. CA-253562 TaxID=3239942 RepID=UPI003D8EBB64
MRRVGSPDDAADVFAETMLVAWRRIDEVPADETARLWLYGVARASWPTTGGAGFGATTSPYGCGGGRRRAHRRVTDLTTILPAKGRYFLMIRADVGSPAQYRSLAAKLKTVDRRSGRSATTSHAARMRGSGSIRAGELSGRSDEGRQQEIPAAGLRPSYRVTQLAISERSTYCRMPPLR